MSGPLIVYYGNDPAYFGIVWEVARLSAEGGRAPVLLDVSPLLRGVGDAINRRVLRAFRISSPDAEFRGVVERAGWESIDPATYLSRIGDHPLTADERILIDERVHSALVSYSRDPEPQTKRAIWRRLQRDLIEGAEATHGLIRAILEDRLDIDEVYVLNGRFPQQGAVLEAARGAGRRIRHYEKGEQPDTFWLADHSTLDREATQTSVDRVLGALTPDEALEIGRRWRDRRVSGGANIYSRFFSDDDPASGHAADTKLLGFFTSSQDEFAALGPEWHVQDWADQWEAFESVLDQLSGSGYRAYLRVHPNFATKSHASFLRERAQIEAFASRHPELTVIWHDEKVNSYALIGTTDVVVVWDSTIGLEAAAAGRPVWELAASYYDIYTGIRQWFGVADTPALESLEYQPDLDRALRFMAYLELREPRLSDEAIRVREQLVPSTTIGTRLAGLVSSGGAPRASIAALSIRDAFLHRRASINVKAARQYAARR